MACNLCRVRAKNEKWSGTTLPRCAFEWENYVIDLGLNEDPPSFEDNWNCATMAKLRNLVDERWDDVPKEAQYHNNEDDQYVTIDVSKMESAACSVFMSWYKDRGHTKSLLCISWDGLTWIPTEAECSDIIEFLEKEKP